MSRLTDTERGARIAQVQAEQVLGVSHSQPDLFPRKLKRAERAEWVSILQAALEVLAEIRACREVLNAR